MKRITTEFGLHSTTADVIKGIDLSGKRSIVTGASSGIGKETARALASAGAEVTVTVRNREEGARVREEIVAATKNERVQWAYLELLDTDSIRTFVKQWNGPLHILVNNAGILGGLDTPKHTREGFEMHFAIHHFGHFALANGLHGALAKAGNARIVSVSSSAHMRSSVCFEDIHFSDRAYEVWSAYAQSKTANILFAVAATGRWRNDGITANALNPGNIPTGLQRNNGGKLNAPKEIQKDITQGAATSVFVATSPLLDGLGGRYFNDCNEAELAQPDEMEQVRRDGKYDRNHVAPFALDCDNAERLWSLSQSWFNGIA